MVTLGHPLLRYVRRIGYRGLSSPPQIATITVGRLASSLDHTATFYPKFHPYIDLERFKPHPHDYKCQVNKKNIIFTSAALRSIQIIFCVSGVVSARFCYDFNNYYRGVS